MAVRVAAAVLVGGGGTVTADNENTTAAAVEALAGTTVTILVGSRVDGLCRPAFHDCRFHENHVLVLLLRCP